MLQELIKQKEILEQQLEIVRGSLEAVMIDISHVIAAPIADIRKLQDKEFGAVNITFEGFKVTETVPKKVEWDQEKLNELFDRIAGAGDDPRAWMKLKLEVSEKQFESFDENIKPVFAEARTVKPGKPVLKLEAINA